MSTNNECEFFQWEKEGNWYYILEHYNAPKNAWDWREHASAYGPFTSQEQAQRHLDCNHANPGSFSIDETVEDGTDTILKKLIDECAKRKKSSYRIYSPRRFY
jgi:hypothetical protein